MRNLLVMDRISQLPDELLLRILSFLPSTKHVVDTMVLSKRWEFLWIMVPKLVYDDSYQKHERFSTFVNRSLLLHEAEAIEKLHFKLSKESCVMDIRVWIITAVRRSLRELFIELDNSSSVNELILPMSLLYIGCRMLVTLKLNDTILQDDSSSISFPSLKTLSLLSVVYPDEKFVERLLSNCHVLEDLDVEQCSDDNVAIFTVRVPSLKSLVLCTSENRDSYDEDGFVIDALSLKHLKIQDYNAGGYCIIENNMPNIVKANVDVSYSSTRKILRSITSVKDLYLCSYTSKNAYRAGSHFHSLVHLKLCTCERRWLDLLMRLLGDSPNLRALTLQECHNLKDDHPPPHWREPSSVPECVKKRLQTLEWVHYQGTKDEKEVAAFFLTSGRCLKKVTIIPHPSTASNKKKLEMIKVLAMSPRRSPTCQLVFD